MKKFLTYTGAALSLMVSFILTGAALFMFTVVAGLLIDEHTLVEDDSLVQQSKPEPEYIEAYTILDDERGVVVWSDPESGEGGKVLYVAHGSSFQFFGRSGDDIHNNRPVMNEITEIMSEKVMEQ